VRFAGLSYKLVLRSPELPERFTTVKQITEIDDPRFVKALAHPLRINILRVLQDRVASPSELADELGARLPNISYHVRILERLGLLELVKTQPRRGALEHYYRARSRLRWTDRAWGQVPDIVKNAMVSATLDQIARYVQAAAAIGGFDRADAHTSRQPMVLDQEGYRELAAALKELLERANEIEAGAAKRIASGNHKGDEFDVGLVMMLFEAPPPHAGIAPPRSEKRHKAASQKKSTSKRS
jgi:DNA-binding transcriptional ArsR family regulator